MKYRTLLALLICINLLGCEPEFHIVLVNGLDQPITMTIGRHVVGIQPTMSASYHYPSVDGSENGIVTIETSHCVLSYKVSRALEDYPWRSEIHGAMPIEIAADLNLYAVPPDVSGMIAVSNILAFQKGMFPLRPSSKNCK